MQFPHLPATGLKGPDHRDERDHIIRDRLASYRAINVNALPEEPDLEPTCPPVLDQSTVSGCVGWSGVTCYSQNQWAAQGLRGRRPALLSPAFAYRECRALDEVGDPQAGIPPEPGSLEHDWGTYVRNFWKIAKRLGVPLNSNYRPEFGPLHEGTPATDYAFPARSIYRREPPRWVYNDADDRQALSYLRLLNAPEIMQSIADGYAVQIGFVIYRDFYAWNGPRYIVPMPVRGAAALGGHAVYIIGYGRTNANRFRMPYWKIRNSWNRDAHIDTDGTRHPNFILPIDYPVQDCWSGRVFER